jgi:hypothetical protein
MPSSKAGFLTLFRIGFICVIINGILLYLIINFVVIPYLDRGRSPDIFEHMFPQTYSSTVTQIGATVIPNPTYFCDTQSCSNTRYRT